MSSMVVTIVLKRKMRESSAKALSWAVGLERITHYLDEFTVFTHSRDSHASRARARATHVAAPTARAPS